MDDQNDQNQSPEQSSANDLMREVGIPPDESAAPEPGVKEVSEQKKSPELSPDALEDMLRDFGDSESALSKASTAPEQPTVQKAEFQQLSVTSGEKSPQNIELLMDVELPVSIELGRTRMNIADILALGPGSIVELDKLVGEPVDLLVNQKCVARGEVVVVEESFGLRITQLMSPEERIKNLK